MLPCEKLQVFVEKILPLKKKVLKKNLQPDFIQFSSGFSMVASPGCSPAAPVPEWWVVNSPKALAASEWKNSPWQMRFCEGKDEMLSISTLNGSGNQKKTARKCWHIQCSTCTKSSICIHFSSWNDLLHHLHSGSRTPKKTAVSARKPKNCMWKPQICHATNSCNSWSHLVPNECCTWIKWSSSEQNQVTLILFPQVFPKKMRQ